MRKLCFGSPFPNNIIFKFQVRITKICPLFQKIISFSCIFSKIPLHASLSAATPSPCHRKLNLGKLDTKTDREKKEEKNLLLRGCDTFFLQNDRLAQGHSSSECQLQYLQNEEGRKQRKG